MEMRFEKQQVRAPWLGRALTQAASWLLAHWLLLINALLGALVGVAVLVPVLYALGATVLASRIFLAYHLICAQIPSHSYFLFGYQMALCARNLAIFGSLFVGSVAFRFVRAWLPPLDWKIWLLTMIPMALDGGTQLFGWRESNWELRTLTGVIFGLGICAFLLPQIEQAARERPIHQPDAYGRAERIGDLTPGPTVDQLPEPFEQPLESGEVRP
jgi:uncharacterized membrane protein